MGKDITLLEELEVLKLAEAIADEFWGIVGTWEAFERQTMGSQWVRAVDSVRATIAEAYGRFHYGEKLQFLYYARGNIFETKYWFNRCLARNLIDWESGNHLVEILSETAHQINAFAKSLKSRRSQKNTKSTHENQLEYKVDQIGNVLIFTEAEIITLTSIIY